jgi:hypothetical protein
MKEKNRSWKDPTANRPYVYIRSFGTISNLEEIINWESINTAWVENLGPE